MTYGLSFAAASVVSQGVAIALGIQDGFDWKQVGLAALSVVALPFGPISGASVIGTLFNSMVGNALAQGIGVLTGLQDHFSWTGVVAAGIGAGFGQTVGEALREANAFSELGKFGMNVAQGTVRGLAAGLTTAALRGGRVSVMQVAADAFGSALGYGLADAMQQAPDSPYSLAYGMRPSLGLKADPGVWNDGAGSGYGSYQPEDLSLTANGTPRLPMQMGDGTSDRYNPAADPEVQARAQRFLERNPIAANDIVDPSQGRTVTDYGASTSVLRLSSGSPDGIDAKLSPEDEIAARNAAREAAQLQKIRDDADALNALKVYAAMGRGEDLAPTIENAARLGLYDTSGDGVPVRFSDSMPISKLAVPGSAPAVQMVERPTYDAMGNVTGTEYVPVDNTPTMRYADQMRNAWAATGHLTFGGFKGAINGVPELITTIGKGWAYLGALAGEASGILSDGATDRTIASLDSKTGRVFEYDNGLQSMGGIAGGMVSPGAYAKGAELGIVGLRTLGPRVAITSENFLARQGLLLRVRDEAPLSENQILKYEAAPYHGTIDNAVKSRAPINAQAALDSSVQVKITSPRRVGVDVENQEFVVFDRTRENIYHGHVRSWSDLHPDMQRALQRAGMVDRRGNILGE